MKLILKSIKLFNFKSYKGLHEINNIDSCFTAIVGPNGSGKSNIIDSILFVLGFRAKKMRHSQITDLIYSDGERETKCFVELIFNKFKIKREVYINKITKYYYDDKEISNNELIKKMVDEGIDMEHNRFLILQGEIESIAMLKPKEGLLEFLEDIIGSSKYKIEIDELIEKSKNMEEENLTNLNNLKFVKTEFEHIDGLKKQNEEILKNKIDYLKKDLENKCLQIILLQRDKLKIEEKTNLINNKIFDLKNKNLESKNMLKTLENESESLKKILNIHETEYLDIKREFKKLDRNNCIQKEIKIKLEKELKILKNDLTSTKAKYEMKKRENTIYQKELNDNKDELKKLFLDLENLKLKIKKEEEHIITKYAADFKNLKECENKLIDAIKLKSEKDQKITENNIKIKFNQERKEILNEEIKNLADKIKSFENVKHLNKNQIEKDLQELEIDLSKTQKELQIRKHRYNEVYQRKENDKKEIEMLSFFKDIKGVFGRLKDIGIVDLKYELALKASCFRLNNIVVDTTKTAEKCIEIIKKNNLQRSTFIILDKLKDIPILVKKSLPYMFELVKCDNQFRKCFYFGLTDTLLADTLETAEKIAFEKQRNRVVTLDGKLIEKSGVMTGGNLYEKVKKYEDIEVALFKINEIKQQKINDLHKIAEFENQEKIKDELKNKKIELKKIDEFFENNKNFKDTEKLLKNIEDVIYNLKNDSAIFRSKLEKYYDSTLRANLQIINEKIEILENRNQEITIILNDKIENIISKEHELNKKTELIRNIEIKDLSELKDSLDKKEQMYNEISNDFKEIQNNIVNLKKNLGSDFHNEIELKNQLDEYNEKISDFQNQVEITSSKIKEKQNYLKSLSKYSGDMINDIECDRYNNLSDQDMKDILNELDIKLKKINNDVKTTEIDFYVFDEHKKVKNHLDKIKEKHDQQITKYEEIKNNIENLKNKRLDVFTLGLTQVNIYIKEIYKKLTFGGNAELETIDYLDPFSDGIRLAVMPPKKCWKNISNLSGGEKTLSSLALIFALHKYKPSPFYVMDEIDAALDFRNVSIISSYIKEMAKTSQFIVISLRNDMFEISNSILGVYKVKNVSKFLMVNINEFKKNLNKIK